MAGVILKLTMVLAIGEFSLHFVLFLISKFIGKSNKDKISRISVLKGMLERTFILVSLLYNMPPALTLLAALKIATRIKDNDDKVSNDFFLIGNLISILFGMAYYVLIKEFVVS